MHKDKEAAVEKDHQTAMTAVATSCAEKLRKAREREKDLEEQNDWERKRRIQREGELMQTQRDLATSNRAKEKLEERLEVARWLQRVNKSADS